MSIYNQDFDIILKENFPFLNRIVATETGFGAFFEHKGKERLVKVIYEEYEKDNNGLSLLEYIEEKIENIESDINKQLNKMYEEATKKPNNKQYYLDKAFKYADDEIIEEIETYMSDELSYGAIPRSSTERRTGKTSAMVFLSLLYDIPLVVHTDYNKLLIKKKYPIVNVYTQDECKRGDFDKSILDEVKLMDNCKYQYGIYRDE